MRIRPVIRVPVLALAAVALGGCGAQKTAPHAAPASSAPQQVQHRAYACGTGIQPPLSPGTSGPVQLRITKNSLSGHSVEVDYTVTSPSHAVLSVPIGPTPPTALLFHAGRIAGYQHMDASGTVDGSAPQGYPLAKPYAGKLTIDTLCAGTTWDRIQKRPQSYTTVAVMSKQPVSGPQKSAAASYRSDPLSMSEKELKAVQ
ncbi:hypothetical protein AB0I77_28345 [Streptomyces sp. NPDC050619]|uniref:hypothetical protein n=1 Tax=Streptomyces sp. NPDC050619 TaxID=3157214 RepID=UPI00342E283E